MGRRRRFTLGTKGRQGGAGLQVFGGDSGAVMRALQERAKERGGERERDGGEKERWGEWEAGWMFLTDHL